MAIIDKSKLSKYDRTRLINFENELHELRNDYVHITESIFACDISEPKKDPYPQWEKWKRRREELQRKYEKTLRKYYLTFAKYTALVSVIEYEIKKGEY